MTYLMTGTCCTVPNQEQNFDHIDPSLHTLHGPEAMHTLHSPPAAPINDWIVSLFGPPHPDPTPLDNFRLRYPTLAHVTSFGDIVTISSKYLKANAIKQAGDHAATFFQNNPRMFANEYNS